MSDPSDQDPDSPDDPLDDIVPGKNATAADVDEAMRLMAWSRKHGFAIGSFSVGRVVVNGVRDMAPRFSGMSAAGGRAPRDAFEDADPTFYRDRE